MLIEDPSTLKDLDRLKEIYKKQKLIIKEIPEPTDEFMKIIVGKLIRKFLRRKMLYLDAMRTPSGARGVLYADQYQRCHYCKKFIPSLSEATLDHKNPLLLGGTSTLDNLCVSCAACNSEKTSMTEDEYIKYRENKYGINHHALGELQVSSLVKAIEKNLAN